MVNSIRLCYAKTGRAVFISHLDVMQVFRRAFRRAELPLRYSEGFNPHPYLSIALPLPVGVESVCERLDVGVTQAVAAGTLPERLNRVLPQGLWVYKAAVGGRPFPQIAFADYVMTAETNVPPETAQRLFQTTAVVDKRTKKKGMVPTDIVPLIHSFACEKTAEGVEATMALAAGQPYLNPEYVAQAWREYLDPEARFFFKRVGIRDDKYAPFDGFAPNLT